MKKTTLTIPTLIIVVITATALSFLPKDRIVFEGLTLVQAQDKYTTCIKLENATQVDLGKYFLMNTEDEILYTSSLINLNNSLILFASLDFAQQEAKRFGRKYEVVLLTEKLLKQMQTRYLSEQSQKNVPEFKGWKRERFQILYTIEEKGHVSKSVYPKTFPIGASF